MGAKLWKGELQNLKYTYDFSVHGGSVGTIALGNLPDGYVIQRVTAVIETALVGGGTFVVGEDGGGDADGYFLDMDAFTVDLVYQGKGALVWAAPLTAAEIGNELVYRVVAAKDGVQVTVGTTAYTAGVISFYFSGYQG